MEYFQATEMCAKCGGECCKTMPCHYSPEDFKEISFDFLKTEIQKGKIAIDWWDGDYPEYYLRVRHINEDIVHGSWGGRCILLTENGCALSWDERPSGGKSLKPRDNMHVQCKITYSKEECKNDWKPYADILEQLVAYFT